VGTPRNVYFPDDVDERLTARVKAAGKGRGEVIRELFDEADGNARRLRHALRQPVGRIRVLCAELRVAEGRGLLLHERLDLVQKIEAAVHEIDLTVAKTGAE
jgi:hypothetical protein